MRIHFGFATEKCAMGARMIREQRSVLAAQTACTRVIIRCSKVGTGIHNLTKKYLAHPPPHTALWLVD